MIPPICKLCGKDFRSRWINTKQGGALIEFADQLKVWFCDEHKQDAQKLRHLSSDNALKMLNKKYSLDPLDLLINYRAIPDPELGIINLGPSKAKVISIVKEVTGLTTPESMVMIAGKCCRVIKGFFETLQYLKHRFDEIGATSEIVFNDQTISLFTSDDPSSLYGAKREDQKNSFPEGEKSFPFTWFLLILILSIIIGLFFGV